MAKIAMNGFVIITEKTIPDLAVTMGMTHHRIDRHYNGKVEVLDFFTSNEHDKLTEEDLEKLKMGESVRGVYTICSEGQTGGR